MFGQKSLNYLLLEFKLLLVFPGIILVNIYRKWESSDTEKLCFTQHYRDTWYYCFFIYSCISFQSDDAQDSKLIFVMVFKWQINTLYFKRTYCFSFFTSMNSFLLFLIQCVNCHLFVVNCDIDLQCTVWVKMFSTSNQCVVRYIIITAIFLWLRNVFPLWPRKINKYIFKILKKWPKICIYLLKYTSKYI